jgi:hypothetical protein
MTDTTTAADYSWFHDPLQYETYCITLVQGMGPEELLQAVEVESGMRITGVDGLIKPSLDASIDHDRNFAAATSLGGWTLMYEPDGWLGVTDEVMLPVSRGRTVVSNHSAITANSRFCWYRDGVTRLDFNQVYTTCREGSHPDELLAEMRESGFDFSDPDDDSADDLDYLKQFLAAFALAHRITGVHLTPELFASAEFIGGLGPRLPSFALPDQAQA